jgi:hypothetical protein
MHRALVTVVCLASLAAGSSAGSAQSAAARLSVDAPSGLERAAARLEAIDLRRLAGDLERAGLTLPARIRVTLVRDADPLARGVPRWVVGLASGTADIVILPQRVLPYPHDSIESVFRHEVAHLALSARAAGTPLPRWFHEGVAISVDTGWRSSGQLRLLLEMIRNPGTMELRRLFSSAAQPDSALAYGLSAALVADLQRRHGSAVPGRVAARVASGVPFAQAFELETRETPDGAAARAWENYRRWTNWVPALTSGEATWAVILAVAGAAYVAVRRRRARRRRAWDEEGGIEGTGGTEGSG